MAEARNRAAWDHTASLLATFHNLNCTKRGDMLLPKHFHPHYRRTHGGLKLTKENLHIAKKVFRG